MGHTLKQKHPSPTRGWSRQEVRGQAASRSPTCQGKADKLHALLAHDGPAEAAVVAAVTNAELIPAVWTEGDILVVDPGHHRLLYCCGKKTKTKHTRREAILKKEIGSGWKIKNRRNVSKVRELVTSDLRRLGICSVKCSQLTRRKKGQKEWSWWWIYCPQAEALSGNEHTGIIQVLCRLQPHDVTKTTSRGTED